MTLEQSLDSNPYKSEFISVIDHLNAVDKRPTNPFEALAIAAFIANRQTNWNGSYPVQGRRSWQRCCCGGNDVPGAGVAIKCEYQEILESPPEACKPISSGCDDVTARNSTSPQVTLHDLLLDMATEAGFPSPWTDFVKTFEYQMGSIRMNGANNWQFFQDAVDKYFENVNFIMYFQSYLNGEYAALVNTLIGGTFRENMNTTGINVTTIADGEDPIPGTRGETTIQVISTDATIDTKYWIMYTGLTTADCAWIDPGFGSGAPVVVIPGVTITYRQVVINPLGTPDAVAGEIVTAFGGIPGYASVIQGPSNTVTFTIATGGLLPASDFTGLVGGTSNWVGGETPGVDPIPGTDEATSISYIGATLQSLYGTYFKMYDAVDDGFLFYYQEAGKAINPASLGVAYTTAVPIDLPNAIDWNDCPTCITATNEIENRTEAAIVGTGAFRVGSRQDGCCTDPPPENCSLIEDENGEVIANPNCRSTYVALTAGDWADSEGGTAAIGISNQINEVTAPDGTVFGTAEDDLQFAIIWNTKVVPYVESLGQRIHYLKPVAANTPYQCYCCLQTLDCVCPYGSNIEYIDCPYNVARLGSLMLQTTYPAITSELRFNTPGTTTQAIDWNDCPTCLM